MTDATFFNGRLNKIFYFTGFFGDIRTNRKFLKAPFDQVFLDGEMYIMPRSTFATGSERKNIGMAGVLGEDEGNEFNVGQQFFYDTLEHLVIEPHEMGDWKGSKDNWLQVHKFGMV